MYVCVCAGAMATCLQIGIHVPLSSGYFWAYSDHDFVPHNITLCTCKSSTTDLTTTYVYMHMHVAWGSICYVHKYKIVCTQTYVYVPHILHSCAPFPWSQDWVPASWGVCFLSIVGTQGLIWHQAYTTPKVVLFMIVITREGGSCFLITYYG